MVYGTPGIRVSLGSEVERVYHALGRGGLPRRMPSTGIYGRWKFNDSGHSRAMWPGLRHLKQTPFVLSSSRSWSVKGLRGGRELKALGWPECNLVTALTSEHTGLELMALTSTSMGSECMVLEFKL